MKSIDRLIKMLKVPNLYANEAQRQKAKEVLLDKMKRRDRNVKKKTQLGLGL